MTGDEAHAAAVGAAPDEWEAKRGENGTILTPPHESDVYVEVAEMRGASSVLVAARRREADGADHILEPPSTVPETATNGLGEKVGWFCTVAASLDGN